MRGRSRYDPRVRSGMGPATFQAKVPNGPHEVIYLLSVFFFDVAAPELYCPGGPFGAVAAPELY